MEYNQIEFTNVSDNEIKFKYRDHTFLLIEQNRGVYGIGRACQLYQLNGLKKEHIKEIAWTKSDNHLGMEKSDAYSKRLETMGNCKKIAVEYLSKLI